MANLINYHYYGQTIRTIFVVVGVVMLITFPFFSDLIPVPIWVSIGLIILLAVFGGLMNPAMKWMLIINALIATVGFALFEYEAVFAYLHVMADEPRRAAFFWINQIGSLLFFIALYLSIKTARGRFIPEVKQ